MLQDEYTFYMEDASSKLLLVPATGSKQAEAAASRLNVPVASMQLEQQGASNLFCTTQALKGAIPGCHWCVLGIYQARTCCMRLAEG